MFGLGWYTNLNTASYNVSGFWSVWPMTELYGYLAENDWERLAVRLGKWVDRQVPGDG